MTALALRTRDTLELRDYQRAAIEALYSYLEREDGNALVVLPTGSGKSLVMAELVRDACVSWPDHRPRILILAHVKELLEQNSREIRAHYPECDLGIYSAGLNCRDSRNQVLVASIQSVYRRAFDLGRFDLILVDEAHLIPRTSDTMYQTFLTNARLMNPAVRVIGLTATDYRLDSGRLTDGEDAFFHKVVYEANVGDLIRQGYLCRVSTFRTSTHFDVSGVHVRGGEFISGELAKVVDVDPLTKAAVKEMIEAGKDRLAWLVFCSSVAHAEHVCAALNAAWIPSGVVTADTSLEERAEMVRNFKAGHLRALCNMNVFTTGFNVPHVDLIALLRPTKSPGLYVQMVGRGTRNAPGKQNCLILDFGQNIERFGPIDALVVERGREKEGTGEAPVKECPDCHAYVLIAALLCDCGHEFPKREVKVAPVPSRKAVLADDVKPETYPVQEIEYERHERPGKTPSMRVIYYPHGRSIFSRTVQFSEWICFEHTGYARQKAVVWWRIRAGTETPATVDSALNRVEELREPVEISVVKDGKYDRIVSYRFVGAGETAQPERRAEGEGRARFPWETGPEMEPLRGDEAPLGGGSCDGGEAVEGVPF